MSSPVTALTLKNVLYEKKGAIAYVTLNRPKVLNALNRQTWEDLRAAFEDAREDAEVRGVILTGAGDKAFIAGADIGELANVTAVEAQNSSSYGQGVLDLIEDLGKPVVAAVNGFALGGGCETAMACTIRVASENAKFGQPEVKLGVIPGGGGTQRLPRLVGKGRALQLILSGEMIDAQEAYRIGLVNEVIPAADLIARAEAILKQIFANAPIAVKFALEAVNKGLETSLADGLSLEAALFGLCAGTEDKKEGTQAFLQKRAAQFQGQWRLSGKERLMKTENTATTDNIFSGLKVVDFASFIAGPAAAVILSDFGADVIKVEPPTGDLQRIIFKVPPQPRAKDNYPWPLDHRNKRGLAVDLKSRCAGAILERLVKWAAVMIVNSPHPARKRLMLTYEDVAPWNPRLIYADLTGYGDKGPDADLPGFDITAYWSRS